MSTHWKVIRVHSHIDKAITIDCKKIFRDHYGIPLNMKITKVEIIHNMIEFYTGKKFQNDKLI